MTTTNNKAEAERLLGEAMKALRVGDRERARTLLAQAVGLDEQNEQAWLWLSGAVETEEEQRICLENVLALTPGNQAARQGLDLLGPRPPTAPPGQEPAPLPPPMQAAS